MREEFGHEKRALWVKELVNGMWNEITVLLPLFFLLGQHPPTFLDRKSSNLLPQNPNLPFQYVAADGWDRRSATPHIKTFKVYYNNQSLVCDWHFRNQIGEISINYGFAE